MEDQSNIIIPAVIIGAIIGFIIGYKLYCIFGWKPEDPSQTTLDFISVSKYGCGLMGMFFGAAGGLGVVAYFIN